MHRIHCIFSMLSLMSVTVLPACTITQHPQKNIWETGWKAGDVTARPETDV